MTNDKVREARRKIRRYSKRDPKTKCRVWTASTRKSYGQVRWEGKIQSAHRVSYQAFVGEIPDYSVVHHTCSNKLCVNPKHLQLVTPQDNNAEMVERISMQRRISELETRLEQCKNCGK